MRVVDARRRVARWGVRRCGSGCSGSAVSMTVWTRSECCRYRGRARLSSGEYWCAAIFRSPRAVQRIAHTLGACLLARQFKPGSEGTPRYASSAWIDRMLAAKRNSPSGAAMRLAAHLCGPALNQVLRGDVSFVEELAAKGFGRVQLNATAVRP